ncbi:amino acid adenylation domain-containing protein [Acanthopleuribacter pedis]|uniref:Amino acid adenylation domain-containing protein n=1 Tax=Acanthopleuribacter pedis TaxID=442870 RepID=A0A8J7U0R5_9BACT|nr:amino acid adenylation domain-containing protein [Acanthopleuribacter pedis]MBO1317343.1 amino acid adenylation domain-containing protein [Acanthopleuribacter pedis]MBO1318650.1 amino acid adenylation domain-containing protein [Acanthopleuribacter pedis]
MKLSDFNLFDVETESLQDQIAGFNQTKRDFPRAETIPNLLAKQAAATPDAVAVRFGNEQLTYAELEQTANRAARFMDSRGIGAGDFVGVMLDRSIELAVSLLAVTKVGAAYLPINTDFPYQRIRTILDDAGAPMLIGARRDIATLNKLQWECSALHTLFCPDSTDFHGEKEPDIGFMDQGVWRHVADETHDDISGGGWRSSYTGELLSREVMDGYGENIRQKLTPLLTKQSRVLEIGCASGISMFRLAPLVAAYHGTDLSPDILKWTESERARLGQDNITLQALPAHEIDQVEGTFDVVIINSVIECFNGHNYLRDVLRKAVNLLADRGLLFLGNLWDQDLKATFIQSLAEFKIANPGKGYRTKTDREEELYVSRAFLEDLRHDIPAIAAIETSLMLGEADSELSRFGFDAVVHINKTKTGPSPSTRAKYQFDRRELKNHAPEAYAAKALPEALAYLIYTSGTAGKPKGVMVDHRAVLRLVCNTNYVNLQPGDTVLQTGSLAFDASTFEIWGPLLNGGTICFPRENALKDPMTLANTVKNRRITHLFMTTALFNSLVDTVPDMFADLKCVLSGGEKVSARHFNKLRRRFPDLQLFHVYGPTESTTFTTFFPVDNLFKDDIPIGRPLANTTCYLFDAQHALCPVGVPGELLIGGDGLAHGYHGDAALTASRFVPNPYGNGERLYRSGDLARWDAEGNLTFLGRRDSQVKIRGFRIEPEELENLMLTHPSVERVAVMVREVDGEKELHAYVGGSEDLDMLTMRDYLARRVPPYMMPTHVTVMADMPLNANGKVNRNMLPAPVVDSNERRREGEPPVTDMEKALAAIWSRIFNKADVMATDNFFDLGGHSLKVTRLVADIQDATALSVPYLVVYKADSLRELARYLDDLKELKGRGLDPGCLEETAVLMNPEASGDPVFAFPPGSGYPLAYMDLAKGLGNYRLYGFTFLEGDDRMENTCRFIEETQPQGAVTLMGFSGGGKLAFQVAVALEARGRKVAKVVMIDAARYLQPLPFKEDDLRDVAREFLDGVGSDVLKEKAYQKMRAYRTYLGNLCEREVIGADLDVLVQEHSPNECHNEAGEHVATIRGWGDCTNGRFQVHDGVGNHRAMLNPPHLAGNLSRLLAILERR